MTDFLVTQMTLYPWVAWLLLILAGAGLGYAAVWAYRVQAFAYAWLGHKREVWRYKTMVMRELREHPDGDDPPEYHPDEDDDELPPEPTEDAVVAFLEAVRKMGLLDDDEPWPEWWCEVCGGGPIRGGNAPRCIGCRRGDPGLLVPLPGEPGYRAPERPGPPLCDDRECQNYGWVHPSPCVMVETLPVPKYTEGPAMPPQPVREYLPPAVMDDLEAAGFSRHETTDGAVDSMFTRAQARVVEAMLTDGIIPAGELGKGQDDGQGQ